MTGAGGEPASGRVAPKSSEAGRYDAFISYSRVDAEVAERLCSRLGERGIDAWLDVEGIVGGEPWMARITRAIEACNAFVFLVSADSLGSAVCREELKRATALNKLVVAVHCRAAPGELPPALAAREAVALGPDEPFEDQLGTLVAVLQRDLPLRDRHTRIAGRARVWEDSGRDPGRLLVGVDLRDAETWLDTPAGRGQAPTAAHSTYVVASRRAANARQRVRMGSALLVLAITAALTVVALVARERALAGKRSSLSRTLAAQALDVAGQDPGLAATLSLEAERVQASAQVREALPAVLPQLGDALGELSGHTDGVASVDIGPDGRMLASAGADGRIRLWDRTTQAPIGRPLAGHAGTVWGVAFSPDGKTLVSGGKDRTVRLWDVATGREIGSPLRGHGGQVFDVAFAPSGKAVASASNDGTLRLWDVATRRQRGTALGRRGGAGLLSVAFSDDGRTLATAAGDGTVRLWDAVARRADGPPIAAHTGAANAVAFAPGARTLASGGSDGMVRLWDVAMHRPLGGPLVAGAGVGAVAFSPEGRSIAIAGAGARVWDVATRRPLGPVLRALTDATTMYGVAFSPDARTLATASTAVSLWNVARSATSAPLVRSFQIVSSEGALKPVLGAGGMAYSPDSRTVAVVDGAGRVGLWDVSNRGLRGPRIAGRGGEAVLTTAFSPDGRTLATGAPSGAVRLWSVATRRQSGPPLRGHAGGVLMVGFSHDGRTLASTGADRTVRLWSVARHAALGLPLLPAPARAGRRPASFGSLAFSPDGKTLATAGSDVDVRFWDVATRRPAARPLSGAGSVPMSVTFSPDGKLIATGELDGTARLWDAATHRELAALRGHTTGVLGVAFSPDSRTLGTRSGGGTVRLWDVARRREIGTPLQHGAIPVDVAFSPDGTALATLAVFTVRLWDPVLWTGGAGALRARACAAGHRNLSRAQWRRLLPGEPYHETCPGA